MSKGLLAADEPVLLPDRHLEDCAGPGCGASCGVLVPRPLTETDWAALLEPVARELLGERAGVLTLDLQFRHHDEIGWVVIDSSTH